MNKKAVAVLLALSQATNAGQVTSLGDHRISVAVTVYNDGRGLVREERNIDLAAGVNEVRFMDVAEQIQAPTVRVAPIEGAPFNVLEQNYEYDLLSPAKLLDKFVGQTITLVRQKMMNNSTVDDAVLAKLLSNNNGTVWEIGGKIVINPAYSRMVFPNVPENLIAKPTLVWRIAAPTAGKRRIEASYITGGMQSADYVLSLDPTEERAVLQGWVTTANNSGASYEDAKLKLVAERRQTDFRHLTTRPGNVYESAHEIKIRNQKDTPVTVQVVEPMGGEWTMIETSLPNQKTAAFESQWEVLVPAGGETVLTYRVRVKY